MAIILDADVVILGERGDFDLPGWLLSRPGDAFELAAITVAELWHSVERASPSHRPARQRYLEAIVQNLPVIPYTEQTAYHHARIWASLAASGAIIGAYDLIVAATALERGNSVATFNHKHFARVKGLKIIRPRTG